MNAAIEALTWSLEGWKDEIENAKRQIEREEQSIKFSKDKIAEAEYRIFGAEQNIKAIADAIDKLEEPKQYVTAEDIQNYPCTGGGGNNVM